MSSKPASEYADSSLVSEMSTDLSEVPSSLSLTDLNITWETVDRTKLDLQQIQDDLIAVAKNAGAMMAAADPSVDSSDEKKNSADRVTATDKAIENMVQSTLAAKYPRIDFLGEETFKEGQKLSDRPTFVCDPIDGTLNFIHGFPGFAISLGLTVSKECVVGVVYNATRNELFTAIKGRGAFFTNWAGIARSLPMKPAAEPIEGLSSCLFALEWGNDRKSSNWATRLHMHKSLLSHQELNGAMVHSVRSNGSAALDLCYVAAGWHDLFWEGGCWIWDVCAGWLIVKEAGGIMAGANPGEWDPTLEGRSYLAVRGAASGQREVVEEVWALMGEHRVRF